MDDPKPQLTCLVARPYDDGTGWKGDTYRLQLVTLEDAVEFKAHGYIVLVDPADEAVLARWQMLQRSKGIL